MTDRPALEEIEITPAMIDAGAEVLRHRNNLISDERDLAEEIFESMLEVFLSEQDDKSSK